MICVCKPGLPVANAFVSAEQRRGQRFDFLERISLIRRGAQPRARLPHSIRHATDFGDDVAHALVVIVLLAQIGRRDAVGGQDADRCAA